MSHRLQTIVENCLNKLPIKNVHSEKPNYNNNEPNDDELDDGEPDNNELDDCEPDSELDNDELDNEIDDELENFESDYYDKNIINVDSYKEMQNNE
ncbi:8796_t:CDS:1, partial [Dentiscutata erythropus]